MSIQRGEKLNALQHILPEGMVVDAAWLNAKGYSNMLLSKYAARGWLEQPTRGLYRRPGAQSAWQHVVISLQMLMHKPVIVGGMTALDLQGFAHYLQMGAEQHIDLYSVGKIPNWVNKIDPFMIFKSRNGTRLFENADIKSAIDVISSKEIKPDEKDHVLPTIPKSLTLYQWGDRKWPMMVSSPERAILEFLDELPNKQTFEHVDDVFSGLSNLRPKLLQSLLSDCKSVKVIRLFLWFADRHSHAWWKHLDVSKIETGSGKRMIVPGGRLDDKYLITVPDGLHGDA